MPGIRRGDHSIPDLQRAARTRPQNSIVRLGSLHQIPYVTLFPAMVVCSLVGGRLAGILAAGVGGIIAWYLWLPPRGTFSLEWPTAKLMILLYVLTSTILLLLTRGLNETLKDHRTVELNLRWPVTSGWYEKRQCAHHQFCRDFITSFYQAGPKQ